MKKSIITFIAVFMAIISYSQNLTATHNLPQKIGPNSSFIVEVNINKGAVSGFIKMSQVLPQGFTAEEVDCKGASFTFNEDGVRIIWMTPPPVEAFTIKYKIATPAEIPTNLSVISKILYMVDEEKKSFEFPIHTFTLQKPVETASSPTTSSEKVKENPVTSTTVAKPVTLSSKPVEASPVTASNLATSGKVYKVQIGAFSAKPKVEGVPEISTLVLDNGITKYFSGNFTSYDEAVKRKNLVAQKGFNGAFIVSFQDGKIVK